MAGESTPIQRESIRITGLFGSDKLPNLHKGKTEAKDAERIIEAIRKWGAVEWQVWENQVEPGSRSPRYTLKISEPWKRDGGGSGGGGVSYQPRNQTRAPDDDGGGEIPF